MYEKNTHKDKEFLQLKLPSKPKQVVGEFANYSNYGILLALLDFGYVHIHIRITHNFEFSPIFKMFITFDTFDLKNFQDTEMSKLSPPTLLSYPANNSEHLY